MLIALDSCGWADTVPEKPRCFAASNVRDSPRTAAKLNSLPVGLEENTVVDHDADPGDAVVGDTQVPFFIEVRDRPGCGHIRAENLKQHLAYLDSHADVLLAAGGLLNDEGSVPHGGFYILEFDDREKAEEFVANDPFTTLGLFEVVQVTRWRKAYFNHERLI